MRVIVAGATGPVGRPLVELLVAAGHEVIGVTRRPDAPRPAWSGAIVADVLDRSALLAAARGVRADAVVNELTAIHGLPRRYRDLDAANRLRVQGTSNLLGLAEAVGAHRLVTRSSFAGYGLTDHGTTPIPEGAPFGVPGSATARARPFVESLKAAERLSRATLGIEGIALRTGLLYGPERLRAMARSLRRRMLPVPRSGGGVHSHVHVRDAAAAAVAALERGSANAAYNVCDDRPVAWADFVDAAARALGAPRPLRVPPPVLRVAPCAADLVASSIPMSNARAKARLGWSPVAPTIEEGLRLAAQQR